MIGDLLALSVTMGAQAQAAAALDTLTRAAHETKMLDFQQNDPWGIGVTIISMAIVMAALVVIYFVFKAIGPVIDRVMSIRFDRAAHPVASPVAGKVQEGNDAAIAAAIGLALHQHFQAMREDDVISLTIKEISRRYSPWNDKSFAAMNNQMPARRKTN